MTPTLASKTRQPATWFTSSITYTGWGRAELAAPAGAVEGPITITCDEQGRVRADLEIQRHHPIDLDLHYLVTAVLPVTREGTTIWGLGTHTNICNQLIVQTQEPEGVFVADESIHYWPTYVSGRHEPTQLHFYLPRALFTVANPQPPHYWVLPLSNLVADFIWLVNDLENHPLRIYQPPKRTRGTNPIVQYQIQRQSSVIPFLFQDVPGFIERLPEYAARVQQLQDQRRSNTLTAVLVATLADPPADCTVLKAWFPFIVIPLLSLATGQEVGVPWVEVRDPQGRLVHRIHHPLGAPSYVQGHAALTGEAKDYGIGTLLTTALHGDNLSRLPRKLQKMLPVAMRNVVRAGFASRTIEEQLTVLFRALDGLRNAANELIDPPVKLSKARKQELHSILEGATAAILNLAQQAEVESALAQAINLRRIAKAIENPQSPPPFGESVMALLAYWQLPDTTIMDAYYTQHPYENRTQWYKVLSAHRAAVIHTGYLDFEANPEMLNELIAFRAHLQDLLLRLIFRLLGYTEEYRSPIHHLPRSPLAEWLRAQPTLYQLDAPGAGPAKATEPLSSR